MTPLRTPSFPGFSGSTVSRSVSPTAGWAKPLGLEADLPSTFQHAADRKCVDRALKAETLLAEIAKLHKGESQFNRVPVVFVTDPKADFRLFQQ